MPRPFAYHEPRTLSEACALLEKHGSDAYLLCGGTDLLVRWKRELMAPGHLIHLGRIPELAGLRATSGTADLEIGALVTLTDLERDDAVVARCPAILEAVRWMGSPQIRNIASALANLCNAAPSADLAPILLVHGASVVLHRETDRGPKERTVPLREFFTGPGTTCRKPNEIAVRLLVPAPPEGFRAVYLKHAIRESLDIAIVGVALGAVPVHGALRDVRIALGAVAPAPMRATRAEAILSGGPLDADRIAAAADAAAAATSPISDVRAGADYRRRMTRVLVRRAVAAVAEGRAPVSRPLPTEGHQASPHLSPAADYRLHVNGDTYDATFAPHRSLLSVLRDDLDLLGANEGCGTGECGACTVLLEDDPVPACLLLAREAVGRRITTIEGLGGKEPHALQTAFAEQGAVQCGYCTPGMILAAEGLLRHRPHPTEEEIRRGLEGNLCRCTGYAKIIAAVQAAGEAP